MWIKMYIVSIGNMERSVSTVKLLWEYMELMQIRFDKVVLYKGLVNVTGPVLVYVKDGVDAVGTVRPVQHRR